MYTMSTHWAITFFYLLFLFISPFKNIYNCSFILCIECFYSVCMATMCKMWMLDLIHLKSLFSFLLWNLLVSQTEQNCTINQRDDQLSVYICKFVFSEDLAKGLEHARPLLSHWAVSSVLLNFEFEKGYPWLTQALLELGSGGTWDCVPFVSVTQGAGITAKRLAIQKRTFGPYEVGGVCNQDNRKKSTRVKCG